MLPPKCISCGKFLADIQLIYESEKKNIESNNKLSNEAKAIENKKLLDKLYITRWCCRSQVLTYCDLVQKII